jgi:hypothetical protein
VVSLGGVGVGADEDVMKMDSVAEDEEIDVVSVAAVLKKSVRLVMEPLAMWDLGTALVVNIVWLSHCDRIQSCNKNVAVAVAAAFEYLEACVIRPPIFFHASFAGAFSFEDDPLSFED